MDESVVDMRTSLQCGTVKESVHRRLDIQRDLYGNVNDTNSYKLAPTKRGCGSAHSDIDQAASACKWPIISSCAADSGVPFRAVGRCGISTGAIPARLSTIFWEAFGLTLAMKMAFENVATRTLVYW